MTVVARRRDRSTLGALSGSKDKQRRARKRQERRADRRKDAAPAGPSGPTFGDVLAQDDLVGQYAEQGRALIATAEEQTATLARRSMRVISCNGCTAAKACCTVTVIIWLYEGAVVAARLRRDGRDTEALRQRLREAAELMETPGPYRRPCVFLDTQELCTVYTDRPGDCGAAFVSSPAEDCSRPGADIVKFPAATGDATFRVEMKFEEQAGLPPLERPYMAALPRMVLLCLQAWDRPDYAAFLAERVPQASLRVFTALKRRVPG